MPDQSRELTPMQQGWDPLRNQKGFKDFSVNVMKSDTKPTKEETREVEEAITPVPKDSSVPESASFQEPQQLNAPQSSVPHALPESLTPTEALEAAVKENGKLSDKSEEDTQKGSTTIPNPETSSQSSSSETSPGKNMPPAVVAPPPVASTPADRTTQK